MKLGTDITITCAGHFMKPLKSIGLVAAWGALLVSLSFGVSRASSGKSTGERESLYEVFSHGLKIGEVKTVCAPIVREQRKAYRFESSTHIDADFLLFSYSLDKKEEAMINEEGTFNYRRTSQENGKTVQVTGRMENRSFRFTIDENGSRRILVIPREKYDFTTLDCPEVSMGPGETERNLRVLDLENLTIVKRKYRWVKDEDVDVAGRNIRCKVIDFQDSNKKGRRWLEEDSLGVLITRQDGKGKGVSYSSRLTSLVVRPRLDSL
jgi:hypothetical protein